MRPLAEREKPARVLTPQSARPLRVLLVEDAIDAFSGKMVRQRLHVAIMRFRLMTVTDKNPDVIRRVAVTYTIHDVYLSR